MINILHAQNNNTLFVCFAPVKHGFLTNWSMVRVLSILKMWIRMHLGSLESTQEARVAL